MTELATLEDPFSAFPIVPIACAGHVVTAVLMGKLLCEGEAELIQFSAILRQRGSPS